MANYNNVEMQQKVLTQQAGESIPELKNLSWTEYMDKHPIAQAESGETFTKRQVLYLDVLKSNWLGNHISLIMAVNKKIAKFNKILAANGIKDERLAILIEDIKILVASKKDVLQECKNFKEVVGAINQQAQEIKDINISVFDK